MVETLVVSTHMPTRLVSPIHHACNTLLKTWTLLPANQLTFAEIAHGHPLLPTRLVSMAALLLTTSTTMLVTTTPSRVPTR
jgi:hypothetical protein